MTFLEQRLELGLNYGATYGPRFNTAIATSANGIEQRRAIWSQPLITVQLGDRRVNEAELNYLLAFHASVKGAFAGFRIRDWSDYRSGWQPQGTGNGTVQSWQLIKAYTVAGVTVTRPITKPIDGTLKVFLDGVEVLAGWSCDYTTGIIYTELAGAIAATFDFDIPVRFEQDKIDFTYEAGVPGRKLFTMAPLTCVELRIEPTIYPALDTLPTAIAETFDLGYDFGTLGGPSFNTAIATNAAEFESRKSYWENPLGSWDIGDRALIRSELDYFIALFRCARGMAIPFNFQDWQDEQTKLVRFAEDRISFRFDAFRSTDEQVIFNLGGVAIGETLPMLPPTCQPASYTYTNALASPLTVFQTFIDGIYTGATYNLDTSGGFWRTTLTYGGNGVGYAARIEWLTGWTYTPQHEDEVISINWQAECRAISHTTDPGFGSSSFPFQVFAVQGSIGVGSAKVGPGGVDAGGVATDWTLKTSSGNLSGWAVGSPIVFYISRSNSNVASADPFAETVMDYRNARLTINVTCS